MSTTSTSSGTLASGQQSVASMKTQAGKFVIKSSDSAIKTISKTDLVTRKTVETTFKEGPSTGGPFESAGNQAHSSNKFRITNKVTPIRSLVDLPSESKPSAKEVKSAINLKKQLDSLTSIGQLKAGTKKAFNIRRPIKESQDSLSIEMEAMHNNHQIIGKPRSEPNFGYQILESMTQEDRLKNQLFNQMVSIHHSLWHIYKDSFTDQSFSPSAKNFFKPNSKPVLALDLDETLVHCCNFDAPDLKEKYELAVSYVGASGRPVRALMNFRPHLERFLCEASDMFDLVIYTASDNEYAEAVVKMIDPCSKYIKAIFHRDYCRKTKKGFVVKDLQIVVGRDTSRTFLVDNSAHCFAPQIHNGIPIIPFTYDKEDRELLHLLTFLRQLSRSIEPMAFVKDYFKLSKYTMHPSHQDLVNYLTENAVQTSLDREAGFNHRK